jgi:16S rRNA (uracil1498-N3)-methyltransferase
VSSARRFFLDGAQEAGNLIEIVGSDAHKITHVLRLSSGDRIEIVDSAAAAFVASIESVGGPVRARLLERLAAPPAQRAELVVDVAQAVPKGRRMDYVVEKCTELGANAFLPFYCERSVGRDVGAEKLARWRRLARAAAQQSGRRDVPAIETPIEFADLLERCARYDTVLFAWELAASAPMRETLQATLPASRRALLIVGPEGGFTHAEAQAAAARHAALLSLGPRILRTDTAAVALLAVITALAS